MSAAPAPAFARRLMRFVPDDRRVKGLGGARGRRKLQARKLVAPFFQRPVMLTTATGLRLRVTTDPVDEQIAHHLLGSSRSDYFPPWPGTMPAAPCILDIGAHHGLYAATALHTYPGSRVICVEPSRDALVALQANLDANGSAVRARVVAAALAPAAGSAELRHTNDGTWGFSLYEDADGAVGSERVQLRTLVEILDGDRPDIVKCNAEGAEYAFIEQLAATDLRPRLIVLMVHPAFGDVEQLLATARAIGYEITSTGSEERPAFQLWFTGATSA
jgi:FkbM family methyltransferase